MTYGFKSRHSHHMRVFMISWTLFFVIVFFNWQMEPYFSYDSLWLIFIFYKIKIYENSIKAEHIPETIFAIA